MDWWGEEDYLFSVFPFSGVPVVVYLAVLFGLALVFAGVAGSVADAAARLAVFWVHPLVAARPWRAAALAAAGLPGVPAAALRGADPVVVDAWRPIERLPTVEQRAAEAAEPRWDGLQEESRADCRALVEMCCSDLTGALQGDPPGGRADDLWVVQCSVAQADRQVDPVDGSAAGLCLALLALLAQVQLAWIPLAWLLQVAPAGRYVDLVDG
jgi:hypothetical protein